MLNIWLLWESFFFPRRRRAAFLRSCSNPEDCSGQNFAKRTLLSIRDGGFFWSRYFHFQPGGCMVSRGGIRVSEVLIRVYKCLTGRSRKDRQLSHYSSSHLPRGELAVPARFLFSADASDMLHVRKLPNRRVHSGSVCFYFKHTFCY